GSKAHDTAALNHFGYTVYADHLLAQTIGLAFNFFISCHHQPRLLEGQAVFTRGISQRLDTAVVFVTGTVKSDGGHTGSLGLLSDALTDHCRSLDVAAVLHA